MNDVRGYFISTRKRIEQADQSHIGVKLGLLCIQLDVPVMKVANRFGVTRQTVYSWFLGKRLPTPKAAQKIAEYIAELEARSL